VQFHIAFSGSFIHVKEQLFHPLEITPGWFFYHQPDNGHFQIKPEFIQLGNVMFRKQKIGYLIQIAVRIKGQHKTPLSHPGFYEPQGGQPLKGGLDGGKAYPELTAQAACGRDFSPGLKSAVNYFLPERRKHHVRPALFLYFFDGHNAIVPASVYFFNFFFAAMAVRKQKTIREPQKTGAAPNPGWFWNSLSF
jgi:hypothetical protein